MSTDAISQTTTTFRALCAASCEGIAAFHKYKSLISKGISHDEALKAVFSTEPTPRARNKSRRGCLSLRFPKLYAYWRWMAPRPSN